MLDPVSGDLVAAVAQAFHKLVSLQAAAVLLQASPQCVAAVLCLLLLLHKHRLPCPASCMMTVAGQGQCCTAGSSAKAPNDVTGPLLPPMASAKSWGCKRPICRHHKGSPAQFWALQALQRRHRKTVAPAAGVTSENVAAKYSIPREEQDKMAASSHKRAAAATASGRFKDEIVPVKTLWKDPKSGGQLLIWRVDVVHLLLLLCSSSVEFMLVKAPSL